MYGLYLHIPFCRRKCRYCDFASVPVDPSMVVPYLSALSIEMKKYAGNTVDTVYVGGGTPSILAADDLSALLSRVRSTFRGAFSEVTVEANPDSLTEDKLAALKDAGATRLSIGAQAMSDVELETLGRVHSAARFREAYALARRYFDNVNVDLIYGLPGQTLERWQETLKGTVEFCRSEHLSLYPLTVEPGTEFERRGITVDDGLQADLYEWSIDYLEPQGYGHYEISNWARPGFESRHNLTYWQNREYIGIGAAAASYLDGRRFKNCESAAEYVQRIEGTGTAVAEEETIGEATRLSEEIILKLRCSAGVPVSEQMTRTYGPVIERLIAGQLLEPHGGSVRLTRRGKLLANQVLKEFV